MLGVAHGLKHMHQYRVKGTLPRGRKPKFGGSGSSSSGGGRTVNDDNDAEDEPLMEGEVLASQEGREEGEFRPYAHRDIKPGTESL